MDHALSKPSTYAVWQKWASALCGQMERIAEIYEAHEEGAEAAKLTAYIERLKLFIDPVAHAQELAARNFDVKGNVTKLYVLASVSLEHMFREALDFLPKLSEDMQRILNSPYSGCNGRTASDVFRGPHGSENHGIGSGYPDERGGLPWKLFNLIEEAQAAGEGYFERGLNLYAQSNTGSGEADQPDRHEFHQRNKRITATGVQ
jgi:hypothetical protein